VIYTVRPISDRTWLRPDHKREWSRFDSTWSQTLKLLAREIDYLAGRDVVFECDVREQDIRNDGMLRANARAETPAIVIAFDSKHGPQLHRCDKFTSRWSEQGPGWQQNARAIGLTLEALRACDRYGAVETGQQYAGFKALPAGRAMPASHMTEDEAYSILGSYQPRNISDLRALRTLDRESELRAAFKRARAANHPDRRDGDRTLWDQVEQAAAVLGVAS
jgi:hypothetical protein